MLRYKCENVVKCISCISPEGGTADADAEVKFAIELIEMFGSEMND